MQLPAEQTSLEPLPHRVGPDGRRPFKSQSARSDGSRFTSDTIWAKRSRVPDSQAPKVDLNKLPIPARRRTAGREVAKLGQGQGPFSRWGALSSGLWALRTLHSGPVISANRTVVGSRHARFLMQRDRALAFKPECHF